MALRDGQRDKPAGGGFCFDDRRALAYSNWTPAENTGQNHANDCAIGLGSAKVHSSHLEVLMAANTDRLNAFCANINHSERPWASSQAVHCIQSFLAFAPEFVVNDISE